MPPKKQQTPSEIRKEATPKEDETIPPIPCVCGDEAHPGGHCNGCECEKYVPTAAKQQETKKPTALPRPTKVEDIVGPEPVALRGPMVDLEEVDIIVASFVGSDEEKQMIKEQLIATRERPQRLLRDGFHVGCRGCGRLKNYCACAYASSHVSTI